MSENQPTRRRATYEDVLAAPEHLVAELVDGELVLSPRPAARHFTLAPDWICEVVSRSTEQLDRTQKLRIYARAGVRHAWLVSPARRTIEPFEAIELELGALWADLPGRASAPGLEYGALDW